MFTETKFKKTTDEIYPKKIFANQQITVDDLHEFKKQLVDELMVALKPSVGVATKKWMKSHEVRRLLKISPGTLQTLKSTGVIPYTKIGGIYFYDYDDIQRLLESGKMNGIQG